MAEPVRWGPLAIKPKPRSGDGIANAPEIADVKFAALDAGDVQRKLWKQSHRPERIVKPSEVLTLNA